MSNTKPVNNSDSADQLEALREENILLRSQLDEWAMRVGENEKISKRLQKSELKVLAAQTVAQIAAVVVEDIGRRDGGSITLMMHDPELELQRIIDAESQAVISQCMIPTHDLSLLNKIFSDSPKPYFDQLSPVMLRLFFPGRAEQVKSTLLMPLVQGGELIGSLNFGNTHAGTYSAGMSTDIIERLAAIITVAMQNTLNQYRLRQAGLTDPLTALNNRRFFEQRLVEEFDRALRTKRPLCCLMIDIDYFKQVNDTHGHQVGDKVLQRVSKTMVEQMRRTDVLARYGGEEFVVLLPETVATVAMEVAERLRMRVAKDLIPIEGSNNISITISVGLSVLDSRISTLDTPRTLLAYADQALYKAKHSGRNKVAQQAAD